MEIPPLPFPRKIFHLVVTFMTDLLAHILEVSIAHHIIPLMIFGFHLHARLDITTAVRIVWLWVAGAALVPSQVSWLVKLVVVPNVHGLFALVV